MNGSVRLFSKTFLVNWFAVAIFMFRGEDDAYYQVVFQWVVLGSLSFFFRSVHKYTGLNLR